MAGRPSPQVLKRAPAAGPGARPFCVYILECRNGALYTGITTDVARRLRQHRDGTGARYTRAHGARRIVHTEEFPDRSQASRREAEIKSWPRRKKLDLIGSKT